MTDDWMAEVKGRVPHRPKRRWWAVAARPMPQMPLDLVTTPGVTAVAAYGLRQMRARYVGPAVNVRRSSDNATMDIGFRGAGDFDAQTFSSFVGGGTGFVATWYDQSVNGYNQTALAANTANQPPIALAGTPSGKPVVNFATGGPGGFDGLISSAIPANTVPLCFAVVTNRTGNLTGITTIIGFNGNSPGVFYGGSANAGFAGGIQNSGITTLVPATDAGFHSCIANLDATFQLGNWTVYVDNGTPGTGSIGAVDTGFTQLNLGGASGFMFIGNMAEAIYWNGNLGPSDVAALTANQRTYYGY